MTAAPLIQRLQGAWGAHAAPKLAMCSTRPLVARLSLPGSRYDARVIEDSTAALKAQFCEPHRSLMHDFGARCARSRHPRPLKPLLLSFWPPRALSLRLALSLSSFECPLCVSRVGGLTTWARRPACALQILCGARRARAATAGRAPAAASEASLLLLTSWPRCWRRGCPAAQEAGRQRSG